MAFVNKKLPVSGAVNSCVFLPQGKLWVPPAYLIDSAEFVGITLGAADPVILWKQEVTCKYAAIDLYLDVDAARDITLQVMECPDSWDAAETITTADVTAQLSLETAGGGELEAAGIQTGWNTFPLNKRLQDGSLSGDFIAHAGKRYLARFSGAENIVAAVKCRSQTVDPGSGHPDGCFCRRWTIAGETIGISAPYQDDQPALLNFVLNPTASHCPALVYGRYSGKYVRCINWDTGTWTLEEIPEAGLWADLDTAQILTGDCDAAVSRAGECYANGDLLLTTFLSGTLPTFTVDGIVVAGVSPMLFPLLGGFLALERQVGHGAPIDVADYHKVRNLYNNAESPAQDASLLISDYGNYRQSKIDTVALTALTPTTVAGEQALKTYIADEIIGALEDWEP